MRIIFALVSLLLFTGTAEASCDFVTADYLDKMDNPQYIDLIKIEVPKSAKYMSNFYKTVLSKAPIIQSKYKKNFKSKIQIKYRFGTCSYEGKIKQHGDYKDHIGFVDGNIPIRSLKVKLKNGNIFNAVKFQLLIPKTRNDLNEVLATIIYRKLGFISPETFKVEVDVNGIRSPMLFQEDAQKELLERNLRREGPIFEGDQTLVWGKRRLVENDSIALARTSNKKWFLKGEVSANITINAFKRLQLAYLTNADNLSQYNYPIQPNIRHSNIFHDFHFLSLALNADHGLSPENRRFYFNVFLDDFEPIYYDGMARFEHVKNESAMPEAINRWFVKNYRFPFFNQLNDPLFYEAVLEDFAARSNLTPSDSESFVAKNWNRFVDSAKYLQQLVDQSTKFVNYEELGSANYSKYISRTKLNSTPQKHILKADPLGDSYRISWEDNSSEQITREGMASVISDMELDGERVILADHAFIKRHSRDNVVAFLGGDIIKSPGIQLSFDYTAKLIRIFQGTADDWVLFTNNDLSDWEVQFLGGKSSTELKGQRFNVFGLTGCLTFFDVKFNGSIIRASDASCEDSINIINSTGDVKKIEVINSASDAVDMDFSTLKVQDMKINNANNDCLDVSGGSYQIETIRVSNCTDKGVSVGEKSKFNSRYIRAQNAAIGVSSKDSSFVKIGEGHFQSVRICYEAMKKKQEFSGGKIKFEVLDCPGKTSIDEFSRGLVGF